MSPLRYYQKECISAIRDAEEHFSIYNLACGTGKTNIFTTYLENTSWINVAIIIFPRIVLLDQYLEQVYYKRPKLNSIYACYTVSSKHETKCGVSDFVKSNDRGLILTTKDSFKDVYKNLIDSKIEINSVIVDEVHNFSSAENMKFLSELDVDEVLGFTATPEGKLQKEKVAYTYRHCDAVRDGYSRSFTVVPYVTEDKKTPENFYKALFYFAEKENVSNVICYHAYSEAEAKNDSSSVAQYKNLKAKVNFKESRFTEGIRTHAITGKMSSKKRSEILDYVRYASNKELNIIHSCNTISEGVDTQEVEAISFVDSKGSSKVVTQAIGRITRISETLTYPSKVFIPFFGTTQEAIVTQDFDDSESTEEVFTDESLTNHNAFRTILSIAEFLKNDNPELYKDAIDAPNFLTAREYSFHLEKFIVNKNIGDVYVGKKLDEIRERNVMVCTTDKEGDIFSLEDFLDDKKNVKKESGVDDWIYLYVDEETEVVREVLGSGRKVTSLKKPKKVVSFGGKDGLEVFYSITKNSKRKTRVDKINEVFDWIYENKKIPLRSLGALGKFFNNLKNIKKGTKKGGAPFTKEEEDLIENFFKTKNWEILTDETFQKYLDEFFNDDVKEIEYKAITRIDKINEVFDWIYENKKIPTQSFGALSTFFNNLKGIKKGKVKGCVPFTKEEEEFIENFFKTKNWEFLTDRVFQKNIEKFFDDDVTEIDYFSEKPAAAKPKAEQPEAAKPEAAKPAAAKPAAAKPKAEQPAVAKPKVEIPNPIVRKSSPPHHLKRHKNTLLSYLENDSEEGRKKLVDFQKFKSGKKKNIVLYPEIEEFLSEINDEWWNVTPEVLRDSYRDMDFEEEFDDTISISATVTPTIPFTAPALLRNSSAVSVDSYFKSKLTTVDEVRKDSEIILDYDEAIAIGGEIEDSLKAEIMALRKEKNKRLEAYLKNHNISALQFMDHMGL